MEHNIATCLTLIPAFPLAAALLVAILGPKLLRENSHYPVILALACSCLCSLWLLREVSVNQRFAALSPPPAHDAKVSDAPVHKYHGYEKVVTLWTWANVPQAYAMPSSATAAPSASPTVGTRDFRIEIALRADALTVMMLTMVTFVATLVAIFAAGYMHGEEGYWRFYSYVALFVFSMTMLVSVSNFVLLFVFWEAVGVCSYLLIGFWYHKPEAAAAGKKAFLVNRVGDFGFALALFLLWTNYGTLNFHDTYNTGEPVAISGPVAESASDLASPPPIVPGVLGMSRLASGDYVTGTVATAICLLLMLGACGKSAQFPLHVWLPDAMEGPTPVSALIHAATMVTAGVYMVTRCTPLFMASPDAQLTVAVIGGITALLAGLIALTQYDLKRVLAYSTVSQLGFMFLGLGTGLFSGITAGMFHLFTHAFFKALLFLGSGSVMHAMHHVIDMRKFSGLRKIMPYTHGTFLVGCLALAGVFPFAGFWSKDAILGSLHDKAHQLEHAAHEHAGAEGHASESQHPTSASASSSLPPATAARYAQVYTALYYVALFTALLTSFYTFRAFFMTFYGPEVLPPETHGHAHESPQSMTGPLMVLAACAGLVGLIFMYDGGNGNHFADFLGNAPSLASGAVAATHVPGKFHLDVAAYSTVVAIVGFLFAMYLYMGDRSEAVTIKRLFNLEGIGQLTDVQWVAQLKRQPLVATIDRGLQTVGLGWLIHVAGFVLGFAALLIAAPLTLSTFVTPYRLSLGKFFFDELYEWFIVKPLEILAAVLAWLDYFLIDGLVNLCGAIPRSIGNVFRSLQMGLVQFYALAMLVGGLALVAAGMLWASP